MFKLCIKRGIVIIKYQILSLSIVTECNIIKNLLNRPRNFKNNSKSIPNLVQFLTIAKLDYVRMAFNLQ